MGGLTKQNVSRILRALYGERFESRLIPEKNEKNNGMPYLCVDEMPCEKTLLATKRHAIKNTNTEDYIAYSNIKIELILIELRNFVFLSRSFVRPPNNKTSFVRPPNYHWYKGSAQEHVDCVNVHQSHLVKIQT